MPQSETTVCSHCSGQKHCTSCRGTGIVDRLGYRMTCAVCSGGGECLPCGGTGEVFETDNGDPPS